MCNSEKSKFLNEKEAKRLLRNMTGMKIRIVSDLATLNAII